jgi:hypothetical protein
MRHQTRRATRPSEPQPSTPTIKTNRPSIPRPPTHRQTTRRTQRPRDHHRPASPNISIDRKRTRPYDGHGWLRTLRTPPRRASTRRPGRGSLAYTRTPTSSPTPALDTKEHHRNQPAPAHTVKPPTAEAADEKMSEWDLKQQIGTTAGNGKLQIDAIKDRATIHPKAIMCQTRSSSVEQFRGRRRLGRDP